MTGRSQIRRQILAVALVPALLIALVLMAFYLHTRLDGLEESMQQRVQATARSLASTSEYALFSGNVDHLRAHGVTESLRAGNDFEVGMLRNAEGRLLIEWGPSDAWRIPFTQSPPAPGAELIDGGQRLIYHQPVTLSSSSADTPLELGGEDPAAAVAEAPVLGWITLQYTRAEIDRQYHAIVRNSVLITLGGLLLGGLLSFRMSTSLSERIRHLAETVRSIGRGELDSRARVISAGELGVLEQGINHMAAALAQSHQRMQREIDGATAQLRETLKTVAAQESRYRELVQNANSIVLKTDLEGRITFFNEFAETFFGYREQEILGQPLVGTLLDPRFGSNFTALLQEPTNPRQQPTRHTTRDGRVVYVNWSVRLLEDAGGARAGLVGIGIDVTENQRTARAIGLLTQAGTRGSEVFADIARVLLTGLDCVWAGIVESGGEKDAPPHLLALLDRRGSRLADDTGDLAQALAAVTANGQPVAVGHDLARLHPQLAQLPGGKGESLFAEPLRDRDNRVIGCVFAAHPQALQPTAAGLNLLQLVARRLALELQRMNDELLLTRARDTALAATEAKSRFLANVSHEIRTPMNGIIGFSRLLMREQLSSRQRGQVEMIQQSAQSLLTIINDILDLSKIEAGKLTVGHEPFELVDTLEELIAVFAVQAHQKGLELCHDLDGSLPLTVVGDSQRLTQILTNLLGNAIKFTDRGVVSLRARLGGDADARRLLLEVVDSGIGIATEARERLFRAFSQVDSTSARRHSGTGLGLAISKQLVELLGGSIGVASTPGQGSRFWVDLPLEIVGRDCLRDRAGMLLDGLDVVLYEHEPVSRAAAASLLGLSGARVRPVADGDGLAAALAAPPDLVVVGQPVEEEASQLCMQRLPAIRADFAGPILVLTCDSINPFDAERCRGCSEWCRPKPLLLKTLELGHSRRFGVPDTITQEPRWLAGRRLVVADDNAVNRALIVTLLTQQGATVTEAGDGAEAVAAVSGGCDLVFMDLQMPGMSGLEAAARLREQLGPACPPLIALTASAMEGERQRSLAAGMHDHLTKPLDEEKLLRVLRTWLGGTPPVRPAVAGDPTATPAATPEPVHDAAGALTITGGRTDLARKMLDLFLSEVPQHRSALAEGWRGGDLAQLRSMLHKLRGSAEYCALRRLSQAVGRAEEALAAGSLDELLLDAVRKELDDAAAEAERQAQERRDGQE